MRSVTIKPGSKVDLDDHPADDKLGLEKSSAQARTAKGAERLAKLGDLIAATKSHAVMCLFQGMDASGKISR